MPSPADLPARVRSVNTGSAEPNPARRGGGSTGHGKRPVESATLRAPGPRAGGLGSGLVGDFIGNAKHHGGDRQAVYAFAREELDRWEHRLDRSLPDGGFAENLTTEGIDVDAARIGDRWAVGDEVVLEVTGPRTPCRTFAHRMGVRGWMKAFTEVGRTGAYLSIVSAGVVRPGDRIRVTHRADHEIDLPTAFRALMGDAAAADLVLAAGVLPEDEQEWLRQRLST